ncbi:InlB B-repeat-containing protein [Floccifex porci]|uniref:InlB B-repeat-containing protein n=1 Tax=Floccifex porci TaxID=2606629 RepID=A0A7X2N401_9FIRM|nr:InlB B-repeat-containing protein [Floccifex porci]MSS02021.1 InlB B-repeat-containing protein [Floccifex porci]
MKRIVKWLIPCLVACFMVVGLVQKASFTFANEEGQTEETTGELNTDESSEFSNEDANSFDSDSNEDESLSEETMSNYKISGEGTTYDNPSEKDIEMNVRDKGYIAGYVLFGDWSSNHPDIVTVDSSGYIKCIKSSNGQPVKVTYTIFGEQRRVYNVYVYGDNEVAFYYLKTPTSKPDSNDTDQWGKRLGVGTINTEGIKWIKDEEGKDKNCFISTTPKRVLTWPTNDDLGEQNADGSYTLTRNENSDSHWMAIFNAYRDSVSHNLHKEINIGDIQSIILHPYKISQNNNTAPDKHVDCTVEIKVNDIVTATFFVMEPGSTSYEWKEATDYLKGNGVAIVNGTKNNYEDKVDGENKYRFDGWYTDEARENKVNFPIEISENTYFYAKYVPKTVTINYVVASGNGTVSNNPETVNVIGDVAGSTATPAENYKFVGWYSDQSCETLVSEEATLNGTILSGINKSPSGEWQPATYYAKFERATQDITVKKDVKGDFGNHNETFNFTYSYKVGNNTVDGDFSLTDINSDGSDNSGTILRNIPLGAELTIVEKDVAGYETIATYTNSSGSSETSSDSSNITVEGNKELGDKIISVTVDKDNNLITITNTKDTVPLTGIIDNTPKGLGLIGSIVVEIAAIAFVLKKKRQLKM